MIRYRPRSQHVPYTTRFRPRSVRAGAPRAPRRRSSRPRPRGADSAQLLDPGQGVADLAGGGVEVPVEAVQLVVALAAGGIGGHHVSHRVPARGIVAVGPAPGDRKTVA